MRAVAVVLALVGCGRIGFSDRSDAANGGTGDGPRGDGMGSADDDAFMAACGDLICSPDAAETCATCGDCNTRAFVCGNLTCDPGEDGSTCAVDCGPSPWPTAWQTVENDLFVMLNSARTSGRDCPSTNNSPVAALTYSMQLEVPARVFSQFTAIAGPPSLACNGASYIDVANDRGITFAAAIGAYAGPSINATTALNVWFTDAVKCPYVMNGAYTEVGVGYFELTGQVGYLSFYIR